MKPLLFSLLAITAFYACDQNEPASGSDQVPGPVQQAFAAAYPATKVEWEAEDDGTFEAEYVLNGTPTSASYSATGELLETEITINITDLPAAVRNTVAAQFPNHQIEEAARITYADGRVAYETELSGQDDRSFDVLFAADGTLLEQATPEVDSDDED